MTGPRMYTANSVLFNGADQAAATSVVAARLHEHGAENLALRRASVVSAILRSAVLRELAATVAELLDLDLGRVLVEGWRRYDRLQAVAMRTTAGGTERVDLAEHAVDYTWHPCLEITVDENRVGEIRLVIRVTLLLKPLVATIKAAAVVALGPGDCTVTATLTAPDLGPAPITKGTRTIRTATLVDLRRPIPLLPYQNPIPSAPARAAWPPPTQPPPYTGPPLRPTG
ncbi:hypothetical protein ACFVAV_00725 [Nocardia sp. NPDC057663]|uniref:hypothetical protein n=1 Tax=Nocardia sp. NPDC057663 TaxID=3346201 RepID=UPI00366FCFD0